MGRRVLTRHGLMEHETHLKVWAWQRAVPPLPAEDRVTLIGPRSPPEARAFNCPWGRDERQASNDLHRQRLRQAALADDPVIGQGRSRGACTRDGPGRSYGADRGAHAEGKNAVDCVMKHRYSKTGFTKLLAADTTQLSAEPLIGLLDLETDRGTIEVAINRVVAERLMAVLVEFLQAGEGDDAPTFAVERSQ
ncbi:mll4695 [Mesorhizobium japonicum MAFF 303099]|uniref:Mll4695 protein n=2 Tax=Mesorhizobium japonicum TaxID=2066070 RepID=Q98DI1_RHILO|nr:mll4695 [Mesorhizobium japonicum MAFF 303099]